MKVISVSVLGLLMVVALSMPTERAHAAASIDTSRHAMHQWLCEEEASCVDIDKSSIAEVAKAFLDRTKLYFKRAAAQPTSVLHRLLGSNGEGQRLLSLISEAAGSLPRVSNLTFPYFAFLPSTLGSVIPGRTLSTSSKCFESVSVTAAWNGTSQVDLTFVMSGQKSILCTDTLLVVSGGGMHIQVVDVSGTFRGSIQLANITDAVKWFINTDGLMVLLEPLSLLDAVGSIIDTVTLLSGYFENPISPAAQQASVAFFKSYVQYSARMQPTITPRAAGGAVIKALDPKYINSGDLLLVMRPDGLDPMIGWGEGSTVGHSTIAIRTSPTDLMVCESTTQDKYWPTNGVQCNPWSTWVNQVLQANMDVVLVPLSPSMSQKFNTSAAMSFYGATQGIDYGYSSFLFGWIDSATANFPCVPPDFTTCLTPQMALVVAFLVDDLLGSSHQNIFRQGISHRVGLWPRDVPVVQSLQHAYTTLGLKTFADIYTMPEMDSWMYNTTRNGVVTTSKSMVCCVFVCNMWKAGGLFASVGNGIQCGEQTLWDIYSMSLFDSAKMGAGRPAVCKQYDPANQLCQLSGNTTLNILPDLNTRPLYKNMGEKCTSQCPNYVRAAGC